MPNSPRDCWQEATDPVTPNRGEVEDTAREDEEDLTTQQLADLERVQALIASAECAIGCDYPDGPLSRSGCGW